jgi:hypothetical protein
MFCGYSSDTNSGRTGNTRQRRSRLWPYFAESTKQQNEGMVKVNKIAKLTFSLSETSLLHRGAVFD